MPFTQPDPFAFVCIPLRDDERLYFDDRLKVHEIAPWGIENHPQGVKVFYSYEGPPAMMIQYRVGTAWYVGLSGEVP